MNPDRSKNVVSIGLVLQATATADAVIAIRGTEGIREWIQDSKSLTIPCPFLSSGGNTEDGFTDMYASIASGTVPGSPSLTKALPSLPWKKSATSLTQLRRSARDFAGARRRCEHVRAI
jgi:hypothetical protein